MAHKTRDGRTAQVTTVYFPVALHGRLKTYAFEHGESLSGLISRYCEDGLARDAAGRAGQTSPPPGP